MFIVANIKILAIILISQMIKGSKEKLFFRQKFFAEKLLPRWRRLIFSSKIWLINNFSLLPFINWLTKIMCTYFVSECTMRCLVCCKKIVCVCLKPLIFSYFPSIQSQHFESKNHFLEKFIVSYAFQSSLVGKLRNFYNSIHQWTYVCM